jgi:predicted enzyme related to lactoylglutathione lyase
MAHGSDRTELAPVAPEFFVPDVAETVRFYTETLGFERHRVESDFAIVGIGDAILMFADERMYGAMGAQAGGRERGAYIDIRVVVPDVDSYHRRCVDAGLDIVHEIADRPYGLRDFIVRDLNGFRLRFASPLG